MIAASSQEPVREMGRHCFRLFRRMESLDGSNDSLRCLEGDNPGERFGGGGGVARTADTGGDDGVPRGARMGWARKGQEGTTALGFTCGGDGEESGKLMNRLSKSSTLTPFSRRTAMVLEYQIIDLMKKDKFKHIPLVVIIAMCFAPLTSVVFADSMAPPKAFAKSSPNGSHYLVMTPPKRDEIGDIVSFGEGKCFKVSDDGSSSMVWTTKGWHNPMIFLSDDGVHLASINYWPSATQLSPETVAIWFFRNGVAFKSVKVVDLIEDESNLLVSASHYQWLHNQINACNLFNQRLDIRTIEGKMFSFDIKSGEIMKD